MCIALTILFLSLSSFLIMTYRFQTVFMCVVFLLFKIIVTANAVVVAVVFVVVAVVVVVDAADGFLSVSLHAIFSFKIKRKKTSDWENKLRKIKLSKTVMKPEIYYIFYINIHIRCAECSCSCVESVEHPMNMVVVIIFFSSVLSLLHSFSRCCLSTSTLSISRIKCGRKIQ